MVSESFTHAIGVTGLMAAFFLVTMFLSGVERASLSSQAEPLLQDVVNYVARSMVDIILVPNSSQPATFIKQIEIPHEVGGQGYTIRLELDSDVWKVTASLDAMQSTYAESVLPWKTTGHIDVVMDDVDMGSWSKRSFLYSGTKSPIVWSERRVSGWEVGLGSLSQLTATSTLRKRISQTFMHINIVEQEMEHSQLNCIQVCIDRDQPSNHRSGSSSQKGREIRGCT